MQPLPERRLIRDFDGKEKRMATAGEMKTYRGSCHCGYVEFEIRTALTRVSECNCSICGRKGYLRHMVSPDRFRLVRGDDALATYQFGTGRALHPNAGLQAGIRSSIEEKQCQSNRG